MVIMMILIIHRLGRDGGGGGGGEGLWTVVPSLHLLLATGYAKGTTSSLVNYE